VVQKGEHGMTLAEVREFSQVDRTPPQDVVTGGPCGTRTELSELMSSVTSVVVRRSRRGSTA